MARYPNDYFTNTVDAAAEYERRRALSEPDDCDDWPDSSDDAEDVEGDEVSEADACGCSDPGCPCSGAKRGGSP